MKKAELEKCVEVLKEERSNMDVGLNIYGLLSKPDKWEEYRIDTRYVMEGLVFANVLVERKIPVISAFLPKTEEIRPTLDGRHYVAGRSEITDSQKEGINRRTVEVLDEGCSLAFIYQRNGEKRFEVMQKNMVVVAIMTNEKLLKSLEEFGSGYAMILDAVDKLCLRKYITEDSGHYMQWNTMPTLPSIWN